MVLPNKNNVARSWVRCVLVSHRNERLKSPCHNIGFLPQQQSSSTPPTDKVFFTSKRNSLIFTILKGQVSFLSVTELWNSLQLQSYNNCPILCLYIWYYVCIGNVKNNTSHLMFPFHYKSCGYCLLQFHVNLTSLSLVNLSCLSTLHKHPIPYDIAFI